MRNICITLFAALVPTLALADQGEGNRSLLRSYCAAGGVLARWITLRHGGGPAPRLDRRPSSWRRRWKIPMRTTRCRLLRPP